LLLIFLLVLLLLSLILSLVLFRWRPLQLLGYLVKRGTKEVSTHTALVVKIKLKLRRLSVNRIAFISNWSIHLGLLDRSRIWELEDYLLRCIWINMNVEVILRGDMSVLRKMELMFKCITEMRILKMNGIQLLLLCSSSSFRLLFEWLSSYNETWRRESCLWWVVNDLVKAKLMSHRNSSTVSKDRVLIIISLLDLSVANRELIFDWISTWTGLIIQNQMI
jgi:hypothetical protein